MVETWQDRFYEERDRRYTEVNIEKEKALRIKEEADKTALALAREIQTYKDEKANELRSQIERERGSYATQSDLRGAVEKLEETLKPIIAFVSGSAGRTQGIGLTTNVLAFCVTTFIAIGGLILAFHP